MLTHPINSPDQINVTYKDKNYVFDSQSKIKQKTRYVRDNHMRGIMSWDLATDVDYNHERSLLKAAVEELN